MCYTILQNLGEAKDNNQDDDCVAWSSQGNGASQTYADLLGPSSGGRGKMSRGMDGILPSLAFCLVNSISFKQEKCWTLDDSNAEAEA